MQILNKTKETIVAENATVADGFVSRMVGLLNRKSLDDQEALVITRCNSIHMFFMRFAIDAIFVNKDDKVVGVVKDIKPFHLSRIYFGSSYVIELAPGVINSSKTQINDLIILE